MAMTFRPHRQLSRLPLAAGIATCLLLAAPSPAMATDWTVTSCVDWGVGSTLRGIINQSAQNGDTIHLDSLSCDTIELNMGPLQIDQDNLTLIGPGAADLTVLMTSPVSGSATIFPALRHSGNGTLQLAGMTISNPVFSSGNDTASACVDSQGDVALDDVTLTQCVTTLFGFNGETTAAGAAIRVAGNLSLTDSNLSDNAILVPERLRAWAYGGAAWVGGDLSLTRSSVSDNQIQLDSGLEGRARGGGIWAGGDLIATDSTIKTNSLSSSQDRNVAGAGAWVGGSTTLSNTLLANNSCSTGGDGRGGGIHAEADLTVLDSVISGNVCSGDHISKGGGIHVLGSLTMGDSLVADNQAGSTTSAYSGGGGIWSEGAFVIRRSTISGNWAAFNGGAMFLGSITSQQRLISNSTIAANQSSNMPAGIYAISLTEIHNSTIVGNTSNEPFTGTDAAGVQAHMALNLYSTIVAGNTTAGQPADISASISGADNLLFAPVDSTIPSDTIVDIPAGLGTFGDHGGPTPTISLLPTSVAIDHGSNPEGLSFDQRGPGHGREVGASADIGAFEFSLYQDAIFANGFEP